jgi:long-subunit fatty acid transport protein
MKINFVKYLYIPISFFLLSNIAFPQGVTDALRVGINGLGPDARALGMGDSYIGLSDDASASFFNPAGFGLLKRIEFSGGLDYTNSSTNTTFFGNTESNSNSATRLNNLSLALPFPTTQGSLVFGISYHQTKGLDGAMSFSGFNPNSSYIDFLNSNGDNLPYYLYLTDTNFVTPLKGNLTQSGDVINSGAIDNWTFSGAIEVAQNLYVGINLNIINGDYNSDNDYYEDDIQGYYSNIETSPGDPTTLGFKTFYLNRILGWGISGWNAKVGMIYQLQDNARLGITVQFPKTYDIKEDFTVTGESDFANAQYSYAPNTSTVKYSIVTPYEIGAGLSYNLKGLILSGQATLIDYSQMEFDDTTGVNLEQSNKDIKSLLGPVIDYNLGAEYTIPDLGVRVRAGYIGQPSPYKNDPPKYSRKYVTGGLGFLFDESFAVDLGYAHGWWSDYGDNYGDGESRTYQNITVDELILTTTFRF